MALTYVHKDTVILMLKAIWKIIVGPFPNDILDDTNDKTCKQRTNTNTNTNTNRNRKMKILIN